VNPDEYQKAVVDPAAVFGSPEEVLARADLSPAQKLHLLRRWCYDARELSVAEAEGMGGGEPSLLERVTAALAALEGTTSSQVKS
jgi:hypothetical protein